MDKLDGPSLYRLEVVLSGRIEPREDYWAARNYEFGITTYGRTSDEADSRMRTAVNLMLDQLYARGLDAVRARFTGLGIPYLFEPTDEKQVRRFSRLERKEWAAV